MKIAILTFSHAKNRGAHMQCYALSRVLRDWGHKVEIIHIELPHSKMSIKGYIDMLFTNIQNIRFRSKFYPKISRTYHSAEELKSNPPEADLYIVGSDQVWNPELTKQFGATAFFFDFLDNNQKRISYAASFGKSKWDSTKEDEQIKNLIHKFNAISVREQDATDICKDTFGIDAKTVLDPVFLPDNYDSIVGKKRKDSNNIVYYPLCLNEQTNKIMLAVKNELQSNVISYVRSTKGKGFKVRMFTHITNWLKDIRNAKIIVTNSFHCMAFCIIFNKKFIVTPPYRGRENRMLSILSQLGIENRYVSSIEDFNKRKSELLGEINYDAVNKKLHILHSDSLDFLKKNI